ncbi:hypothetical protein F8O06_03500 [Pseudoclavibacter sp. CFCC 14310]|uniref:hypothetical protein n=1 Tax=Pseudoclavibacter sp. CFCC 14310 TaxID=2615180 RepID=UPI001300F578|nr:hypothetical protein [Pseudoclavibacter sp. CFCC 14310]KAB1647613.1 hypothetical protein F8O06_03500 [Pseudoclavibacter sp. CFCC 14310]
MSDSNAAARNQTDEADFVSTDNATEFLRLINVLERELRRQAVRRDERNAEKMQLNDLIRDSDALFTRRERDELHSFRVLRNSIVHEPYDNRSQQYPIAVPRDQSVARLRALVNKAAQPPKLADLPKLKTPVVLDADAPVSRFLELVAPPRSFSQAPLRDGDSYELVTTNLVARWLAAEFVSSDGRLVAETPLRALLEHAEKRDRVELVSETMPALEALRALGGDLDARSDPSIPPAALLVMRGREPVGILTQSDIPDLLHWIEG